MDSKYVKALAMIDEAHLQDPNRIMGQAEEIPYELHYAQQMTSYLGMRRPEAPPVLAIAVRAQHLRRWEVPRNSYPMTRPGYHAWRTFLKRRQAEHAAEICSQCGLDADEVDRIAALIRKENLKQDEDTQVLEDVACLVFLDDQFEQFEKEHDEVKIVSILKKTWVKMSERGHELALQIDMSERAGHLVQQALAE